MINETLISQVKRKLNITWDDEDTTKRITEIIESAIPDMTHMLGITDSKFDFSAAGLENTLFLAYCLYEWNHVLDEFEANYASKLGQAKAKHAVAYHLANSEVTEDAEE